MKCPPFGYVTATNVEEATSLLHDLGSDAKVLAGGQSLVPLLAFRLVRPSHLVDVNGIEELASFESTSGLSVGALVRHRMLETAPVLQAPPWTAFGEAARLIGHLPIRVRGTFGGSLAHADPSAELPLIAITFGGDVTARSSKSTRAIPIDGFFQGFLRTALEPEELLTGIRIFAPPRGAASAFEEFAERSGDFAIIAVCCAIAVDEDGACSWARIGVAGAEPVPARIGEAEELLVGAPFTLDAIDAAADVVTRSLEPVADNRGDATFRRELMRVLTVRALRRLRDQVVDPSRGAPASVTVGPR